MRKNAIKEKLAKGEKIVNGWCSLPDSMPPRSWRIAAGTA